MLYLIKNKLLYLNLNIKNFIKFLFKFINFKKLLEKKFKTINYIIKIYNFKYKKLINIKKLLFFKVILIK